MPNPNNPNIDLLWISQRPLWPLTDGVALRGFHLAKKLASLGVSQAVATLLPLPHDAPDELRQLNIDWPIPTDDHAREFLQGWAGPASKLRLRFAQHQGLHPNQLAGVIPLINQLRPAVVLGLGLHSPLLLKGLQSLSPQRRPHLVWYAADELLYYQWSCAKSEPLRKLPKRFRELAVHALLETLFVPGLDAAIGASPNDTRLLKSIARARHTFTIRNGVDLDHFAPAPAAADQPPAGKRYSIVFWGRMDFAPNIQAVCWFAKHVWPQLVRRCPTARWQIAGPNPHLTVSILAAHPGVEILDHVPDIRPLAQAAKIVVLPMRSGGGIKNKLLEAAALARPIVASHQAVAGLLFNRSNPPFIVSNSPKHWAASILKLWDSPAHAAQLASSAHAWVRQHHDWNLAASELLNQLPTAKQHALKLNQPQTLRKAA